MKAISLGCVLLLASGSAHAAPGKASDMGCDVESRYTVSTHRRAFVFKQEGRPAEIGIGGGRLFMDGREVQLVEADHQRLRRMESEMHQLVPEVQQVAAEAVDIAFTALIEVARGLASDPQPTIASLEQAQRRVRAQVSRKPLLPFDDQAVEGIVGPIITEFVPQIVGGVVSSALKSVFSGGADSKEFEARIKRMEQELQTRVETRAEALEPLAKAMCERIRRIDELDNALEYRLADGEPLQLLQINRHRKN